MMRILSGSVRALMTSALLAFVAIPAIAQVSLQKGDTTVVEPAQESPVEATRRFEVVRDRDVLEFMSTSGVSFGFAENGTFVCAAAVGGQPVLMADNSLEVNEFAYLDAQNVVEFKATAADGKLVVGILFLVTFSDREKNDSNVHLVFQLSDPDGYGGVRYIFDNQTSAIYSLRCICGGVGTSPRPCYIIECDEGLACGDPARPRGCRWDIPQGPRIKPVDGGSAQVER